MREVTEVRALLERLEAEEADALEAQDLDFKEWPAEPKQAIRLVIAYRMADAMLKARSA